MGDGVLLVSIVVVLAGASPCVAGNNHGSYSAVHVKSHEAKQGCENLPAIAHCEDLVLAYSGCSFDAFPVFFHLNEYKGMEYGMTWPAWTYSGAFANCADLVIGSIKRPGDEVAHAWQECQVGPVAIPGWIWLYADGPGLVCLSAATALGGITVLDCNDGLNASLYNYCAGVCGEVPECYDACWCWPATEPSTWGSVKSLFTE